MDILLQEFIVVNIDHKSHHLNKGMRTQMLSVMTCSALELEVEPDLVSRDWRGSVYLNRENFSWCVSLKESFISPLIQ